MPTDDYIKRSELIEHFRNYNPNWGVIDKDTVLDDIRNFNAADVEPVRHGKWIKSPECPEEYDICSVCGLNDKHRTRADQEHPAFESLPFYCKWCGAKMDKGEDE